MQKLFQLLLNAIPWAMVVEELSEQRVYKNIKYLDREPFFETEWESLREECIKDITYRCKDVTIDHQWMKIHTIPLVEDGLLIKGIAGILIPMENHEKEYNQVKEEHAMLQMILDALPDVVFFKDHQLRYRFFNKAFRDFYAIRNVNNLLGKNDYDIADSYENAEIFLLQDIDVINTGETTRFEYTIEDRDGRLSIEENVKIPVKDSKHQLCGIVGLARDNTERKKEEERLRYLSEMDLLTDVYNRHAFHKKIEQYNQDKNYPMGIIMGDINGLKLVNDTMGHYEGDRLLRNAAKVFKVVTYNIGDVYRWGGDEFIVLLPRCDENVLNEVIGNIKKECKKYVYQYVELSISLGRAIKYSMDDSFEEVIKKAEEVYQNKLVERKSMRDNVMISLVKALEDKGVENKTHWMGVREYSLLLGKEIGLQKAELEELKVAAKYHDIGKIGIRDEILLKPGKLTPEEYITIKQHSEIGSRIITACSGSPSLAHYILTHHEHWDGNGYPMGIKGSQIPLISRIIHITDAYESMTRNQVYKKAKTQKEAFEELNKCAGTQFDPNLVPIFIECIQQKK